MKNKPWLKEVITKEGKKKITYRVFKNSDEAWKYAKSHKGWYIGCYGGYENACWK